MPTFREEFPDFDPATMPEIPAEFVDASWKNDTCPNFFSVALYLRLYVDFADPKLQEERGVPRFTLYHTTAEDGDVDSMLSTNDWSAVLALVEERRRFMRAVEVLRIAQEIMDDGDEESPAKPWCESCEDVLRPFPEKTT